MRESVLDSEKMKEIDSILGAQQKFNLAREFVLMQPELTRILKQSREMHNSLLATNISGSLGLGHVIEEWRRTARELARVPAIVAAENARLFGGLRTAIQEGKSFLAVHMESHRMALGTLEAINQQWVREFASASALLTEAAKVNFVLPEQALLLWSAKTVALRAPLLDDCIRNTAALEVLHSAAISPSAVLFPDHLTIAGQFVVDHAELVRRLPPPLPEPQRTEQAGEGGRHRDEEVGTKLERTLGELDNRFVELRRQAWRNVSGGIPGARLAMAGIREIFTDILHTLSPDAEVKKTAIWQNRPDQKDPQVTRRMRLVYVVGEAKAAELDAAFQFDESVRRTQKFVHRFAEDAELVRVQMAQLENWIYLLLHFAKSRSGSN